MEAAYDIGDGEVIMVSANIEHDIESVVTDQPDKWTEIGSYPMTEGPESGYVETTPNKVCVFSVADFDYTPETDPDLPEISLTARAYQDTDGQPEMPLTRIFTGTGSIIIFNWEGSNFDSYSLDIMSGPSTGTISSGNAYGGFTAVTWTDLYQDGCAPTDSFNAVGTYVVRMTVTNLAGTAFDEVTIVVVAAQPRVYLDAVIKGYTVYVSSDPYMIDTSPELHRYLGCGSFTQFYYNNDGTFNLITSGGTFPSPADFQWLSYDIGAGPVQPVDGGASSQYELKWDIFPPEGTGTYYPFPWNWWASLGYTREEMGLALDGMTGAGSATKGVWHPLSNNIYFEVEGYKQWAGETIAKPCIVSVNIRKVGDSSAIAGASFTLLCNPPEG